jgi:hypothetical protein
MDLAHLRMEWGEELTETLVSCMRRGRGRHISCRGREGHGKHLEQADLIIRRMLPAHPVLHTRRNGVDGMLGDYDG